MQYQIVVTTENSQTLAKAVNEQIQQGWKPQGGPVVAIFEKGLEYYQAMVKD